MSRGKNPSVRSFCVWVVICLDFMSLEMHKKIQRACKSRRTSQRPRASFGHPTNPGSICIFRPDLGINQVPGATRSQPPLYGSNNAI